MKKLKQRAKQYQHYSLRIVQGSDHWQLFCYKSLFPTDQIDLHLRCDKDLLIKGYMIFDKEKNYTVDLAKDKKNITISCSQWLKLA